jgi:hypothetical protein
LFSVFIVFSGSLNIHQQHRIYLKNRLIKNELRVKLIFRDSKIVQDNKHKILSNSYYLFLNNSFDDFDELATAIRAQELELRQLDCGQSKANPSQIIEAKVIFYMCVVPPLLLTV